MVYNKLPLESLTEPLDAAIEELLAEMGESVELVGIEHEAVDATAMADD